MYGKGRLEAGLVALALLVIPPAFAEESAEEIAKMLTWWDEFGSDWDKTKELIELTLTDTPVKQAYALAENTVEKRDGRHSQE
ncbi:MAG: hypothetical protein ACK4RS_00305 [Thiothrix sp.]